MSVQITGEEGNYMKSNETWTKKAIKLVLARASYRTKLRAEFEECHGFSFGALVTGKEELLLFLIHPRQRPKVLFTVSQIKPLLKSQTVLNCPFLFRNR